MDLNKVNRVRDWLIKRYLFELADICQKILDNECDFRLYLPDEYILIYELGIGSEEINYYLKIAAESLFNPYLDFRNWIEFSKIKNRYGDDNFEAWYDYLEGLDNCEIVLKLAKKYFTKDQISELCERLELPSNIPGKVAAMIYGIYYD